MHLILAMRNRGYINQKRLANGRCGAIAPGLVVLVVPIVLAHA
ncbi:hypothetical protein [Microseira wollei]|nr:hypothetical protein [Microseira wollei]